MGIWLISFQVRDDLIESTKVDLFEILLREYFRGKLRDDKQRLTRASVLLVPLLTLGSKSTSLSPGFFVRRPKQCDTIWLTVWADGINRCGWCLAGSWGC